MLREIRVYGTLAEFLGQRVFHAVVNNAAEAIRIHRHFDEVTDLDVRLLLAGIGDGNLVAAVVDHRHNFLGDARGDALRAGNLNRDFDRHVVGNADELLVGDRKGLFDLPEQLIDG